MADESEIPRHSKPITASRRGRGRPKGVLNVDDAFTRRNILNAALKTFSVYGFDGASIAKIARLHKVTPPLIHYYFKDKEEIWRAAIDHGIGTMISDFEEIIAQLSEADSLARLKFFIRRYITLVAERPEVFTLILRESEMTGPRFTWLSKNYLSPLYDLFLGLVDAAQREGFIKKEAPSYHVAQVIMGACYHFISSRNRMLSTYGVDTYSKEARDSHANLVIDTLFSGLEIRG
ncbi:TetR/AcrR family transcriptional regulator [Kordiimonas pumila]|uniref:TetR/AcrR family transcriptional regulator n=1 Tax=Kordiimonas pumila TaxID=2161677 RepID=A0ABV7D613_9PROT|nr:CerR family C-terminal domain-containing protein [Kordiimonas pumila]